MPKLIVLDFNRTISIEHTTGAQSKTKLAKEGYIASNIRPGIKEFIIRHLALGNRVAIASFIDDKEHGMGKDYLSGETLIQHYLAEILKDSPFSVHQIPIVARYPQIDEPIDKKIHLETLKEVCNLTNPTLYDDKEETIEITKAQGYDAVLVPVHAEDSEFWNKQVALLPSVDISTTKSLKTPKESEEFKIILPPSLDDIRKDMTNKVKELSQEIDHANKSPSFLDSSIISRKVECAALEGLLRLYWENLTQDKLEMILEKYSGLNLKHNGGKMETGFLIETLKSQLNPSPYSFAREETRSLLSQSRKI